MIIRPTRYAMLQRIRSFVCLWSVLLGGVAWGDDHADCIAFYEAGVAASNRGEYSAAARAYEQALALTPRVYPKDAIEVATILNNLGLVYVALDRLPEAERAYLRVLQIRTARLPAGHLDIAQIYNNMGILYFNTGRYSHSESYLKYALNLRRAALGARHPEVAQGLNNLAVLARQMGKVTEAESCLIDSIKIHEASSGPSDLSLAGPLANLSSVYVDLGNGEKAVSAASRSLRIYEHHSGADHPETAEALNVLAIAYHRANKLSEAELALVRGLKILDDKLGPKHARKARMLSNLARVYAGSGRADQAVETMLRSVEIARESLGDRHADYAVTLENTGIFLYRLDRFAESEPYLNRALEITLAAQGEDHPNAHSIQHELGLVDVFTGRFERAAERFDRSRRASNRYIGGVLAGLSESQQLQFLQNTNRPRISDLMTFALRRRADPSVAALSASWVINVKGQAQQSLAQRMLLVRDSGDAELKKSADELAIARQNLAAVTLIQPTPGDEAAYRRRLRDAFDKEQSLASDLARKAGRFENAGDWVELDAVRKALPAKTRLVEILRFNLVNFEAKYNEDPPPRFRYSAWIIPAAGEGEVKLVDLGDAKVIDEAVAAFQASMKEAQTQGDRNPLVVHGESKATELLNERLAAIGGLVLEPLRPQLADCESLLLCPDDALWLVPWAALPASADKDAEPLVDRFAIQYLVSGRDVIAPSTRSARTTAPAIFADPDFDRRPSGAPSSNGITADSTNASPGRKLAAVARLPGTAQEAALVEKNLTAFAGESPKVYLNENATEGVIRGLRSPKALVISTHGFFLPDAASKAADAADANPLVRSGLLLAGCNLPPSAAGFDDGILTAKEIVGCDYRGTELVVLSACETGIGAVNTGEGVAGLRQAFQLAGARNVVATLWQIPDRDSALLVNDFFANLAAGQSNAQALRTAQLARIKSRRQQHGSAHPLYWAAWTVTGS